MRAIIVMFDTLNRHMLPPYGRDWSHAPNFARLAPRAVTFDNCYAGSMPCMPARREMHTGRHNFLHRSWGPLEPFDDSMPELLKRAGVYTHLVSRPPALLGGRRRDLPHPLHHLGVLPRAGRRPVEGRRSPTPAIPAPSCKRNRLHCGRTRSTARTCRPRRSTRRPARSTPGWSSSQTNADADNWMLQIETLRSARAVLHPPAVQGPLPARLRRAAVRLARLRAGHRDQPSRSSTSATSTPRWSACATNHWAGCWISMDEHDLWDDTMLIVNTDHGFLLGEHGWWAQDRSSPGSTSWSTCRCSCGTHAPRPPASAAPHWCRPIDVAPTMLELLRPGHPQPTCRAATWQPSLGRTSRVRDGALFGIHGGHVNVTDGRYVYMRAPVEPDNAPLEEYTLMPTHMRGRFDVAEFADAELAPPFGFTKGVRPLRMTGRSAINPYAYGTLMFDLESDPQQENPIVDDERELHLIGLMVRLLRDNEAPASQFRRLGLPLIGDVGVEHLLVARQRERAAAAAEALPPLDSFPDAELNLETPLHELLARPAAADVVTRHLPALRHNELVNMLSGGSIYSFAAVVPVPRRTLTALADELAALPG